mgnify:CR=1 FL=1
MAGGCPTLLPNCLLSAMQKYALAYGGGARATCWGGGAQAGAGTFIKG